MKGKTIEPEGQHWWIEGTADGENWERLVPYAAEADAESDLPKPGAEAGLYKHFRVSHVKPRGMTDDDHSARRAAEVIAGGNPPERLLRPLATFVTTLRNELRAEKAYPGRPELRKRLQAIAEAARLIQGLHADTDILQLIIGELQRQNRDDQVWVTSEHEMMAGLRDLTALAKAAAKRIPKIQGPKKHYAIEERFPPAVICALVVTVAWNEARGKWPGVNNEDAQRACDALWGAAGGDVVRRGRESLGVWRGHLRNARKYRDGDHARRIRHHFRREKRRRPTVPGKSIEERASRRYGGE
jgi:hypothetical protein